MKKMTTKKLILNRETLSSLESNFKQVVGGISAACTFSIHFDTCATCEPGCTTTTC